MKNYDINKYAHQEPSHFCAIFINRIKHIKSKEFTSIVVFWFSWAWQINVHKIITKLQFTLTLRE